MEEIDLDDRNEESLLLCDVIDYGNNKSTILIEFSIQTLNKIMTLKLLTQVKTWMLTSRTRWTRKYNLFDLIEIMK